MTNHFKVFRSAYNLMRSYHPVSQYKYINIFLASVNVATLFYVLKYCLFARFCFVFVLFTIPVFGSIDIFSSAASFNLSKMIASRVISLITVIHMAMSETTTQSDTIKMCGGKLSDMIRMTCRNTGYNPAFDPVEVVSDEPILQRVRRGVADECCRSGCSLSTLELYCAPPSQFSSKSPVKRTTDESGNGIKVKLGLLGRLNSLTDSTIEMRKLSHLKDVKRQVSGENGVDSSSTGSASGSNSEWRRESNTAVYDEIKNNEEGEKFVERELESQRSNNILDLKLPQRTTWHSAQQPSSNSGGLSTNAVPNTSSNLRESTSSQQAQTKTSSLNNDLASSTSKRTTLPPLQIGVQTPYFLGKQLFQPKTRHPHEIDASKHSLKQNEQ